MNALKKILKNLLNEYGTDTVLLELGEIFQHYANEAVEAEQFDDGRIWLERSRRVRFTEMIRKKRDTRF